MTFGKNNTNFYRTIKEIRPTAKVGEWIDVSAIRCIWAKTGKTSFVEYKMNKDPPPSLDDFAENISKVVLPSGRRLHCTAATYREVLKYNSERNLKSFVIGNLEKDADKEMVENILAKRGFPMPNKIKIQNLDEDRKEQDDGVRAARVELALKQVGAIEYLKLRESVDGSDSIADVVYYDPEDARKV